MRRGRPWLVTHGLPVGVQGRIEFISILQGEAQIKMRPCVVGAQLDGPAKRDQGIGCLAQRPQSDAQVVMRLGEAGS